MSGTTLTSKFKSAVLLLLGSYKKFISPVLPPSCRYVPTCSEYAMEAIECYGIARGGWLAAVRLLRCHPFAAGGYDPLIRAEQHSHTRILGLETRHVRVLKES